VFFELLPESDPVGMGLADLSMNPIALLEAKTVIRSIVYEERRSIMEAVSRLFSLTEI
jgi:phosphoenolpyruvate-protein kinase (PTS system EI component)